MAEKPEMNVSELEKLLHYIAESQEFGIGGDSLSVLLQKNFELLNDEMSEAELDYVTAAIKPVVPKYKTLKHSGVKR